jgi:precorrin-2 dehydrogenase/sirohydrochlorin ferrochelatase
MKYLPIFLDFSNKLVVIFGAGSVGKRKMLYFMGKAKIRIISESIPSDFKQMANHRVEIIVATINEHNFHRFLQDAFLVIPATNDPSLNEKIAKEAQRMGKLVNLTTSAGEVLLPSLISKDNFSIAISTHGMSPGLSKLLRIKLEECIPKNFDLMVKLITELRNYIKMEISDQKEREKLLWEIMNDAHMWELLDQSYEEAERYAFKRLKNGDRKSGNFP